VLRKFRNVGDFVSPDVPYLEGYETIAVGSPLVALANLGPQEVSADINETEIARVWAGQPVEVSPNAYPQLALHGAVSQISPRADRNKNTIEVKVTLEPTKTVLPYDASVKLTFVDPASAAARPGVTLPAAAVIERAGRHLVFVVSQGRANAREVEASAARDGTVTVTSGLSDGERVVVSELQRLEDGARVSLN
jgi:RND family efflux transporter MFP subunit